jgi:hypothetical protein
MSEQARVTNDADEIQREVLDLAEALTAITVTNKLLA